MTELSSQSTYPWLFGPRVDILAFAGSALLSIALLVVGDILGILHGPSPEWIWVPMVLLIDVAHVWSTVFRVYLDRDELRRRPWLYWGTPCLAYACGVLLYQSVGGLWFWRIAAYLAVFHFVRQQYGWVSLYRKKGGETGALDRWIDTVTIYAVTVYPLLYWHTHLPQQYWWFVQHDFVYMIPTWIDTALMPVYWMVLAGYTARASYRWFVLGRKNPGKDIVVFTSALCWYLGIVYFNSDYAFTVTNVVIHGVPYFVLIYYYGRRRLGAGHGGGIRLLAVGPWGFLLCLVVIAFGEELLWDKLIWAERSWLFGDAWSWGVHYAGYLVPLLATPQLTHYILDGFIWRRQSGGETPG